MVYKDLLLQLPSYPDPAPVAVIEQAVSLAKLVEARLSALTFEVDLRVPASPLANAILDVPGLVANERAKSVKNVRDLMTVLDTATATHGVTGAHVVEQCSPSHIPEVVAGHARTRDLTIIPLRDSPDFQQEIAESVIFGSGRPVLILPATPRGDTEIALDVIGVAWDVSRPAARAVADALPILQQARTVRAVTVTGGDTVAFERFSAELTRHLACHGVSVIPEREEVGERSVSQAIEDYAMSHDLDLIVMGAYGHSRLRDFLLGGVTRSTLCKPPPLPILLAH